jgi:hypothetical protein
VTAIQTLGRVIDEIKQGLGIGLKGVMAIWAYERGHVVFLGVNLYKNMIFQSYRSDEDLYFYKKNKNKSQ